MESTALVWFRRDLRDGDHAALSAALRAHRRVHCAFVFDTDILERLPERDDRRVTFIWDSVRELHDALVRRGGGLHVLHAPARAVVPDLATRLDASAVYVNRDYEPDAIARDDAVADALRARGRRFHALKDQVIFEEHEVRTRAGTTFTVYGAYRKAWMQRLAAADVASRDTAALDERLAPAPEAASPTLEDLGFRRSVPVIPAGMTGAARTWQSFRERLGDYAELRDRPAAQATSGLSVHLRFGTVSIRELVRHALEAATPGADAWLRELVWREFLFSILAARPDVVTHACRREFDDIAWEQDEGLFDAWRDGRTGYPLVDAAMRELAMQGTMHNRLRMVSASFLVKHLGIDWRRGEAYFARKLLDYDLAANNGNWQWCASTGCDAQPWFRIFNPTLQGIRFDPDGTYVRRWLPALARVPDRFIHEPWRMTGAQQEAAGVVIGRDYPAPVVEHAMARQRALARYAAARRR